MRESKSCKHEDRLSELPDSLIQYIFEFLPMADVVRTMILSSRWKNLWTTMPCLIISSSDHIRRVAEFVNGVLSSWRGVKIIKFVVDVYSNETLSNDIDSWVQFAKEKKVEDFCLHLMNRCGYIEDYLVPHYLYSCSSFKQLSFRGCTFDRVHVQWNQVKNLSIDSIQVSENDINQILSGCPRLEVFMLSVSQSNDLSIRSTSLKVLSIKRDTMCESNVASVDTKLRISTPNLETLQMLGSPHSKCSLLMNAASLNHASLGFYHTYCCFNDLCIWDDFLGDRLKQISPIIQHVKKVTLSKECIKVLGAAIEKYLPSPFPNVKILELNDYLEEYEHILGLLVLFPKLKMLVLEAEEADDQIRANHAEISLKFERDLPKSIHLQLRTVEFSWTKGYTPSFGRWSFELEDMIYEEAKSRFRAEKD